MSVWLFWNEEWENSKLSWFSSQGTTWWNIASKCEKKLTPLWKHIHAWFPTEGILQSLFIPPIVIILLLPEYVLHLLNKCLEGTSPVPGRHLWFCITWVVFITNKPWLETRSSSTWIKTLSRNSSSPPASL